MVYDIVQVLPGSGFLNKKVDELLEKEGITRDAHLDYTCAITDEDGEVAATGSCFLNTLRCFAVSDSHQGEGLMNRLAAHLMEIQLQRGNLHLFIYTKTQTAKFFCDIGFYQIAVIPQRLCFLENRKTGFSSYLEKLKSESHWDPSQKCGAVIMNANPFTLGHQYLVEQAAAEVDVLHLFVVREDASIVPYNIRRELVRSGTAHLKNIVLHDTDSYLISNATFPSYFLKEEALVSESHARLDAEIFLKIAAALGISCRYIGKEPKSEVTFIYNRILSECLPANGVECKIIDRKKAGGSEISASTVRQYIHDEKWEELKALIPKSTLDFFLSGSDEAQGVIRAIQNNNNLIHH